MSKADSTAASPQSKPDRPPGSPLFAHASRRWAKKIRGKFHYFGKWEDGHDAALASYLDQRDALHKGLTPADTDELTVGLLCKKFLTTKIRLLDAGELSQHTYDDYDAMVKRLQKALGKSKPVSGLRPSDFERLRSKMAKAWGPVRLGNEINRIRVVFNYAYKNGLIDRPMIYGEGFKRPSKKTLQKHRDEQGPRMFEAAEVRDMLDAASQPLRSMVLLGVNCGFGNNDVATLPMTALDLDRGWISFPRPKTGVRRRCPLWPETIEALRSWLKVRPDSKDEAHAGLVFLTKYGGSWAKETSDNPVSKETRKLLDGLKINGGRNFYGLRHTFQTIGDESRDFIAVKAIMGHTSGDISDVYRERVSDERLRSVTDAVRAWVFAEGKAKTA